MIDPRISRRQFLRPSSWKLVRLLLISACYDKAILMAFNSTAYYYRSAPHVFASPPRPLYTSTGVVFSGRGGEGHACMLVTGTATFNDSGRPFASCGVVSSYAETAYRLTRSYRSSIDDFQPVLLSSTIRHVSLVVIGNSTWWNCMLAGGSLVSSVPHETT